MDWIMPNKFMINTKQVSDQEGFFGGNKYRKCLCFRQLTLTRGGWKTQPGVL